MNNNQDQKKKPLRGQVLWCDENLALPCNQDMLTKLEENIFDVKGFDNFYDLKKLIDSEYTSIKKYKSVFVILSGKIGWANRDTLKGYKDRLNLIIYCMDTNLYKMWTDAMKIPLYDNFDRLLLDLKNLLSSHSSTGVDTITKSQSSKMNPSSFQNDLSSWDQSVIDKSPSFAEQESEDDSGLNSIKDPDDPNFTLLKKLFDTNELTIIAQEPRIQDILNSFPQKKEDLRSLRQLLKLLHDHIDEKIDD